MSSAHPPDGPRESPELEGEWEVGWAGHQAAQRRRIAALPFSLKLDWLEEAHRLVVQLRRARAGDVLEVQAGSRDGPGTGSNGLIERDGRSDGTK